MYITKLEKNIVKDLEKVDSDFKNLAWTYNNRKGYGNVFSLIRDLESHIDTITKTIAKIREKYNFNKVVK